MARPTARWCRWTADAVTAWSRCPASSRTSRWTSGTSATRCCATTRRLAAALARRGITDRSRVLTDLWAYGADLVPPRYRGLRLGWADVWYRGSEEGNPYAHHLSGLHPIVDLNRMTLLEIEDEADPGGQPRGDGRVPAQAHPDAAARGGAAGDQPARRGLVPPGRAAAALAELGAAARLQLPRGPGPAHGRVPRRGRLRPVAHRLSFAEMVVPYRDPTPITTGGPRSTSASGAWAS